MIYAGDHTLQAVILDWSGTVVDCGALGQAQIVAETFSALGVAVLPCDVTPLTGLTLQEQIDLLCALPRIAGAWQMVHGRQPDKADKVMLLDAVCEALCQSAQRCSAPIAGAIEAVDAIRASGLLVGSCTEYPRPVTEAMADTARRHGYTPNVLVSASDVPRGLPAPDMCAEALRRLGIRDHGCAVTIGDSPNDVLAGVRAGLWVIGLTLCGSMAGMSEDELNALDQTEKDLLHYRLSSDMLRVGAHYTAPDLLSCLPLLDEIAEMTAQGRDDYASELA